MIPPDCMPRTRSGVVFEVLDDPDSHGRQHFFQYRLSDYNPSMPKPNGPFDMFCHSQIFHARLADHMTKQIRFRIVTRPPDTWSKQLREAHPK